MKNKIKTFYKSLSAAKKRFLVGGTVLLALIALGVIICTSMWMLIAFLVVALAFACVTLAYLIGDILCSDVKRLQ